MKVVDLLLACANRQTVELAIGHDTVNINSISGQADMLYEYIADLVKDAEVGNVSARGDVLVVWVDEEEV